MNRKYLLAMADAADGCQRATQAMDLLVDLFEHAGSAGIDAAKVAALLGFIQEGMRANDERLQALIARARASSQ